MPLLLLLLLLLLCTYTALYAAVGCLESEQLWNCRS
jgi:hypothetical protein